MSAGLCGIVGEYNCLVNELCLDCARYLAPSWGVTYLPASLTPSATSGEYSPHPMVQSPCSPALSGAPMNKTENRSNLAETLEETFLKNID